MDRLLVEKLGVLKDAGGDAKRRIDELGLSLCEEAFTVSLFLERLLYEIRVLEVRGLLRH